MARTYKVGPSGSFGARYGTVARKRYATVITELRAPHECPQCHISAVKRLSVGVWLCDRCGFKFAGGAYAPITKLGQVAERAARAGVASSIVAERKAQKAKAMEAEAKAKTKRRRRKAVAKKAEAPKETETEDKAPEKQPENTTT
ncbi:MAG TPA: 50S ribosomal protein L37ae [Candidatus Acidoferrales bacterium]|nr:50S ribosomal protein L37ae [Candidatus Acidoferrales bacterium]